MTKQISDKCSAALAELNHEAFIREWGFVDGANRDQPAGGLSGSSKDVYMEAYARGRNTSR
jgi:hypothetical protein